MRKNLQTNDTIFSLASGRLPSAVAVEKISGPLSFTIAQKLFRPAGHEPFIPIRKMWFGSLMDYRGAFRDEVLLLSFVSPHSHTGEDSIEIHCHGSRAIVESLEKDLLELGARPAEKGEFTYRALINGKITPDKIDELGDLFQASRPHDLNHIYRRRDSTIAADIDSIRGHLIRLRAILETSIDFSEEYSHVLSAIHAPLRLAKSECSAIIHRYSSLKSIGNEPRIVLAGAPNAGKSSLFNALLGRYRSIVREEPGTTRDVLEETIELTGRPWRLVDTAGIRDSSQSIESEGIALAKEYLGAASFWVLVVDGYKGLGKFDLELLEQFGDRPHSIAWNKSDLAGWHLPELRRESVSGVSSQSSAAIVGFAKELSRRLEVLVGGETVVVPTAVEGQRLVRVVDQLEDLERAVERLDPPEILAEKSREILSRLEGVVGEVTVDDVLDRVFSEFCIGK